MRTRVSSTTGAAVGGALVAVAATFGITSLVLAGSPPADAWRFLSADEVSEATGESGSEERLERLRAYKVLRLDEEALSDLLAYTIPKGLGEPESSDDPVISIPMPDGSFARFRIWESRLMSPELEAQWPEMKAYRGRQIEREETVLALETTPSGVFGMVYRGGDTVHVEPVTTGRLEEDGGSGLYISYYKSDYLPDAPRFVCRVGDSDEILIEQPGLSEVPEPKFSTQITDGNVRSFDFALNATGEYTQYFGSQANAASAMLVTLDRVRLVYQLELGINLLLVWLNPYPDPATDPFTNGMAVNSQLLDENQDALDDECGSSNYDIGHVVTRGSGGLAGIGACGSGKGRGGTGSYVPLGDPFDVDYVAHEVGHQFGGMHTFNADGPGTDSCEGNRWDSSAYEPGSGSTIMGYAGICAGENVQQNSDDYFHHRSLQEIFAYVSTGGGTCGQLTVTGNTPPTASAGIDHTIPRNTPFVLVASGTDPDGQPISFCWEQHDLGEPSPPPNNEDGPMIRSLPATTEPSRGIPRLGHQTDDCPDEGCWESLPTVDRELNFRVVVRDTLNGVSFDDLVVTLSGDPFRVTYPNGGDIWNTDSQEMVTWEVGGGSAEPSVDVLVSVDGGLSFSAVVENTPNDGSELVTVPCAASAEGRLKVAARGNIFFDVSDDDFLIRSSQQIDGLQLDAFPNPATVGVPVSIEAYVTNSCGAPVTNAGIVLSTNFPGVFTGCDSGGGQNCTVTSDANGVASATFTASVQGNAVLSATGDTGGYDTVAVTISSGSIIASASPNPVSIDLPSTISVAVTDGAGQPASAGSDVTFSTTYPGFFSGNNCVGTCASPWTTQTDANGETWLRFTSSYPGFANITISALGNSTILPIEFVDPTPNMNVQVSVGFNYGTSTYSVYSVSVWVTDSQGQPVPYQRVDFDFSPHAAGSWVNHDYCDTGVGGSCDVDLRITQAGEITVWANAGQASGTTTFHAYIGDPGSTPLVPVHTSSLGYSVYGLDFSPDGSTLVAASEYGNPNIRAWNTSDWSQKWAVQSAETRPYQVSINPVSTYAAVMNSDGVEIRNLANGAFYCQGTNADSKGVLGHWISSTSYVETSWNHVYKHSSVCAAGALIVTLPTDYDFEVQGHLDYSSTRNWIAACNDEGTMIVWNTAGGQITEQSVAPMQNAYDTDFSADGSKLAAVGEDAIKVFNTSNWTSTSYSAQALGPDKFAVKFIDGDSKLAVGSQYKIEIVNVVGGASFAVADVDSRAFEMAWNPLTEELAVGTESGTVYVFRPLVPPDAVPPLISVTYPANGAITDDPNLTTTGRVTDQTAVSAFTIDGISVTPDSQGYFNHTLTLAEGPNTITYYAEDPLGHSSTEVRTVTLVLDHIAPVISNTSVTPLSGYAGTVFQIQSTVVDGDTGVASVTATIRDSGSVIVATNPMAHAGSDVYVCTADSTGAEPGIYTIDITAVDSSAQANQQMAQWAAAFEVLAPDTAPPTVSGTTVTPTSGDPGTPFLIQSNVTDDSGIASVTATVRRAEGGFSQALPMALAGGGVYGVTFVSTSAPVGSYVVDITAVDSSPNSNQQTVTAAAGFEVVVPLPGAFNKLTPANGASNQPTGITLTWGTSTGATSYEYCIDTSNNANCDASWVSVGNVTSAALSGLVVGTTYSWQVRAVNSQGNTQANGGAWWTFTTQAMPGAFSKTAPANGATNLPMSLSLTWSTSTDATSYEYCIDTSNNANCDASWVSVGNVTSAALSGLVAGTTYSWQVRAVNSQGNTQANGGTWWTFTTLDTQPDLPFEDGFESGDTSAWSATVP